MTLSPRAATPTLLQIDAIVARLTGRDALQEVCRYLRSEIRAYRWVGVYRVEGTELVLDAWDGPAATEHTRIPISRGVCGRAVREGRTIVVADVRTDTEYLACFRETRAEIVVPIRDGATVLGEIDIDGNEVGAFDGTDGRFLEEVARRLTGPIRAAAAPPPSG